MVDFETDIESCIQVLKAGGLILYPTDTVWGIGCDATNSAAVKKIYDLKKRNDEKALIVLMADERDILKYVSQLDLAVFDYLDKVTKPTTVIYEGAIGLADNLVAADGTVAIRLSKDEFCRTLLKRFRKPIVSTSANLSGEVTATVFDEISEEIKNGVDFTVQHRRDDLSRSVPSSVIKWGNNGSLTIIRP
jgi:L-threonylcarbamoyladenylate synthase